MRIPRLTQIATASLALIIFGSCGRDTYIRTSAQPSSTMVVELLEHSEGGLTVAETVSVERIGQDVKVAGVSMRLLERWSNAEVVRETANDNSEESHAVELSWEGATPAGGDQSEENETGPIWIYQTAEDGPAGVLPGGGVQVRVLPPGARPSADDQWASDPRGTVQFGRDGHFYPVSADGGEVFPGWSVKGIRTFEHALVGDDGGIEESPDAGFVNRCIEVSIASTDGTIERHLCFLDHPKLTKGIHPAFLPVSRLAGDGASQSRLAACDPIDAKNAKHHRLLLSPNPDPSTGSENAPGRLRAFTWNHLDNSTASIDLDTFPAEVIIGETRIRLLQHRNRAQSILKWQKAAASEASSPPPPDDEDAETQPSAPVPALVLMWLDGHDHQRTVLPLDRPTPVRINGEFHVLRYRSVSG